jgi:hypothetical protein
VPVIEVTGLRRSYRSRTGVLRRSSREVEAVRQVAGGDPLSAVTAMLGREAAVGLLYVVIGMALLRFFEEESRRRATLHIA